MKRSSKLLVGALILIALLALAVTSWRHSGGPLVERFQYDSEGRLILHRLGDGATVKYQYSAGRLESINHSDGEIRFSYDGNGNVTRMQNEVGPVDLSYDALDRLVSVRSVHGKTIAYEYDPWGRIIAVTPSGGDRIEYERDVLGRVVTVFDGRGLTMFEYRDNSVTRHLPNGVVSRFDIGSSGELRALRHELPSGQILVEYRYSRDGDGRIVTIDEVGASGRRVTHYGYDAMSRLTSIRSADGKVTNYQYDPMGNRVAVDSGAAPMRYEYSEGLLKRIGPATFENSDAGNRIGRRDNRRTKYQFDDVAQLRAVETDSTKLRYEYDATGARVGREINGEKRWYLYDASTGRPQIAAEYDASGKLQAEYIVAGRALGVRTPGGQTDYFLEDHLGSVRFVVDDRGDVKERYDYTAFGEPIGNSVSGMRFAGEEWDAEAGLLYLRNRYMDPETGRFLSRDRFPGSLSDPQSFNRYVYAANDPVNWVDPTGMAPEPAPADPYSPIATRDLQQWWQNWAVSQLMQHPGSIGDAANAAASLEYAFLEHFASPVETNFRKLADPSYAADHPIGRYLTGIQLAADTVLPFLPETGATKISLAKDVKFLDRFNSIPDVGKSFAENHTYLPFGLDKAYPSSKSLRFTTETAGNVYDFAKESLDLGRELTKNAAAGNLIDRARQPVGGVRLDQTATFAGSIGVITGAVYEPESGRIVLLGDKNTSLPATRAEDLAVALRGVFASEGDISMSIDPDPRDPHGPKMNVVFFGGTERSHAGAVMFEADRIMKGLSVGIDNISREPLTANFPGFHSLPELGMSNWNAAGSRLWSRFWLVPEKVSMRLSPDGNSLLFSDARMRIKTETMRWAGGKLISAGGQQDAQAEYFATQLTAHYDDLARQYPIYSELTRLAQVVALARWMKDTGIPVDPQWVDRFSRATADTPLTTPSVTNTLSSHQGNVSQRVDVFGGAVLNTQPTYSRDPDAARLPELVRAATLASSGEAPFDVHMGGRMFRGATLPSTVERVAGSLRIDHTDILGLTRYYDSIHGRWSLLLPRLCVERSNNQYLSIPGRPQTAVRVRSYFLTDDFGWRGERLQDQFVDAEFQRIGFRSNNDAYRGLYPEGDGSSTLLLNSGAVWLFDKAGRAVALQSNGEAVHFEYNTAGILTRQIHGADTLQFEYANNHLVRAVRNDGVEVQYGYDSAGNLVGVNSPGERLDYGYENNMLVWVKTNGQLGVRVTYDASKRWTDQRDGAGKLMAQQRIEGNLMITTDRSGARTISKYTPAGALIGVEVSGPDCPRCSASWSDDRRRLTTFDGRGIRKDFLFDERGRLAETKLAGTTYATYQYDDERQRSLVTYQGFQQMSERGGAGKEIRLSILPSRSWTRGPGDEPLRAIVFRAQDAEQSPAAPNTQVLPGIIDALGGHSDYLYDVLGRISKVSLPDGSILEYSYDLAGRLVEYRDRRGSERSVN